MYICIILKLGENKRPLATGPLTPRLYGKFKFLNYCKLEVRKIVIKFDIEFHLHTVRTARFSKKSPGSDVGVIKKMSEKLKKKVGVDTTKCQQKIDHSELL